ncbi:MAG: metal ABC transporter solute-binding protein, Zn/Mn family [Phycisphaerae bacterium]
MRLFLPVVLISALCVFAVGCDAPRDESDDRPAVFVSVPPQAFLVERIAGDAVDLHVLVGPNDEPHHYEPTQREMVQFGQADVYFRTGVPFEKQLLPKLRSVKAELTIVDTRKGLDLLAMEGGHHDHDDHDHQQDADPHVWMSPRNAIVQARTIAEELKRLIPDRAATFEENLRTLTGELEQLDSEIAASLEGLEGRTLLVFHPAFAYFADAYGLKQVAIEQQGKSPGPRRLAELIERARSEKVRVIFVHPQFSDRSARTIAEAIGGAVVQIDPLARNYIENLRTVARRVKEGLQRD